MVRKAAKERAGPPPTSIGDHVRTVRRERGLLQREVAELIGVAKETVANWEKNKAEPVVALMPAVIRFLGYEPWPDPVTLGERMRAYRLNNGLPIKQAATQAGVDPGSWAQWEETGHIPGDRYRLLVEEFIGATRDITRMAPSELT